MDLGLSWQYRSCAVRLGNLCQPGHGDVRQCRPFDCTEVETETFADCRRTVESRSRSTGAARREYLSEREACPGARSEGPPGARARDGQVKPGPAGARRNRLL